MFVHLLPADQLFCLPLTRMWVLPFICLCYLLNFIFLCFCMIACEFFLLFVLFAVCWSLFACQDVSAVLCLSYLLFAVYWPPLLCLCLPPYRCCSLFCSLPADHFIALLASLWVLVFIHLVCLLIFVFAYQYVSATPLLSADLYITLFLLARMRVVTLVHHIFWPLSCFIFACQQVSTVLISDHYLLTSFLLCFCLSGCEHPHFPCLLLLTSLFLSLLASLWVLHLSCCCFLTSLLLCLRLSACRCYLSFISSFVANLSYYIFARMWVFPLIYLV